MSSSPGFAGFLVVTDPFGAGRRFSFSFWNRAVGQMLIPRFSLRVMLLLIAICAVISLVMGFAIRGAPWAIAVTVSILLLVATFGIYVITFAVTLGLAWLQRGTVSPRVTQSPFAEPSPLPARVAGAARPADSAADSPARTS
jgi:hypothetical protein